MSMFYEKHIIYCPLYLFKENQLSPAVKSELLKWTVDGGENISVTARVDPQTWL